IAHGQHGGHPHPDAKAKKANGESGLPRYALPAAGAAAGILLIGFLVYFFRPETTSLGQLQDLSEAAVSYLVKGQADQFKAIATKDSAEDTLRFFKETVTPQLEELRRVSGSTDLEGKYLVMEISAQDDRAQVLGIFTPTRMTPRASAITQAVDSGPP